MRPETLETRHKLLETATFLFAQHGFEGASIRMICKLAEVNAVTLYYHFSDKKALYHEALRHACRSVFEKYPPMYGLKIDATPKDRLYVFIRGFLLRILGDKCNVGFVTLIMREMMEPNGTLDEIVDDNIHSLFNQLVEIVRLLVGDNADRDFVLACSRNIMSQCLIYLCNRSVITRMTPDQKFEPVDIDNISELITSFSLSALKGMANIKEKRHRS